MISIDETLHPILSSELFQRLSDRFVQNHLTKTLGYELVELRRDYCVVSIGYRDEITNGARSGGTIHGGIVASLADVSSAYALATNFDGQMSFATVDLHINFMERAVSKIYAHASVVRKGRRINVMSVDVFDSDDQLVAKALLNFMLTKSMEFH